MTPTLVPAEEDTGNVAAYVVGDGPPVVLIHGVGLRAQAWDQVARHLQSAYRLHAVDMPGHGQSPLAGAETLEDFVTRIAAYLVSLEGVVHVVGHSMGAMIALELAAQRPERVAGVVALNAIYRRNSEAAQAVKARAAALRDDAVTDPSVTLTRWFGKTPTGQAAEAREACRTWLTGADPVGYKTAYTIFAASDSPADAVLRRIRGATLFMTGAEDLNSTPAMSQAMADFVTGSRAESISGAAHMMPMTHAEATARMISQVFAEAQRPSTAEQTQVARSDRKGT